LEARGATVLLSGIRREHATVLDRLGVYEQLAHERHVFERTPEAISHARTHAARLRSRSEGQSTDAAPETDHG
jgi:SulP family sulfate permease